MYVSAYDESAAVKGCEDGDENRVYEYRLGIRWNLLPTPKPKPRRDKFLQWLTNRREKKTLHIGVNKSGLISFKKKKLSPRLRESLFRMNGQVEEIYNAMISTL